MRFIYAQTVIANVVWVVKFQNVRAKQSQAVSVTCAVVVTLVYNIEVIAKSRLGRESCGANNYEDEKK